MEFEKLTVQVRAGRKKGVARRLRREGMIPAVCYGPEQAPLALSVDPKVLGDTMQGPKGRNAVIEMTIEGPDAPSEPVLVMLQDHQYHPVDRAVLHADFLQVAIGQEVTIDVPFELTGRPAGVQEGGILTQIFRSLPVRCLPRDIPSKIVMDVTPMELGDIKRVEDLDLPEGVTVELIPNRTLVNVLAPTMVSTIDEEEEEEGEELEEGAEESAPEASPEDE